MRVGVRVDVGVLVGAGVLGVVVGVPDGAGVGVSVGSGVGVSVGPGVLAWVGVSVGAGVPVPAEVAVAVGVAVRAGVSVPVAVGVGVRVGVSVAGAGVPQVTCALVSAGSIGWARLLVKWVPNWGSPTRGTSVSVVAPVPWHSISSRTRGPVWLVFEPEKMEQPKSTESGV